MNKGTSFKSGLSRSENTRGIGKDTAAPRQEVHRLKPERDILERTIDYYKKKWVLI